jgi:UDP-2-acetamido-2,6-beta-L-arabino-hexul-4-ose reductase
MNALVTGAGGFIGKNLICALSECEKYNVMEYHFNMEYAALRKYCEKADIVFHLAGVNRPNNDDEFITGNVDFTQNLVNSLRSANNKCPIIFSSSIQAELNNPYGNSKRAAENILLEYAENFGVKVAIYRLPNVFGKWSKPNYNSAVATFCYQAARSLPMQINNPSHIIKLVYIDDVINEFLGLCKGSFKEGFNHIYKVYEITVEELARTIAGFAKHKETPPDLTDEFTKKLYSAYISFLPKENLSYDLESHTDYRGSFTEFMRTNGQGQFSVNVSKPHIIKGNHYHHTKHEKFLVVSGEGIIRLRRVDDNKVYAFNVSGENLQVVEIPAGYTHNIENTGETDMATLMWANENFDPQNPDTFYLEV